MSQQRLQDQGRRALGELAELAQARCDLSDAGAVEQADGDIAQHGHNNRLLADMDQAPIFSQRDIFGPMQGILDLPVSPLEGEGLVRRPVGARLVRPYTTCCLGRPW